MASSNPKEAAQIPAKCQFCDESEICWKCINCDSYLCQFCSNRIHSKLKSNQPHQFINVRACGTKDAAESHRQVDLDNLTCLEHEGQKCVSYCCACDVVTCFQCSREAHLNHDLKEITKVYRENISLIKDSKSELESKISFFNGEEKKLEQLLTKVQNQHRDLQKQILKRDEELKDVVTKHTDELRQKLDGVNTLSEDKIKDKLKTVQQTKKQLQEQKTGLDSTLHTHHATDILKTNEIMSIEMPAKEVDVQVNKLKFISAAKASVALKELLGEIQEVPCLKRIKNYITNMNDVSKILHLDDNDKLVLDYHKGKLQRLKFEKDKMAVETEESLFTIDMAMLSNKVVLFSTEDNGLQLYTKEGNIEPFKTFPNLYTLGIAINERNEVIVGLTDSRRLTLIAKNSIVKVVVLNQSKDLLHTYHCDSNNQRLFTWPLRIVPHKSKICVIDSLKSSGEGRIVMMDYGGNIHWMYTGCGMVNTDISKFSPHGLAITSKGIILVADSTNHAIHVLNLNGQGIVSHKVGDLGFHCPASLSIDSRGLLWIGCETISVKEKDSNAEIHVTEMFNTNL